MQQRARRVMILVLLAGGGFAVWRAWGPGAYDPNFLPGYLEGETMFMAAPVSGTVNIVAVMRGQHVEKATPLFSMDSLVLAAQRSQAEAQLHQAEAQVAVAAAKADQAKANAIAAKAQSERAQADLGRYLAVQHVDRAALAQEQVDSARSTVANANAQHDAAENQANAEAMQVTATASQVAQFKAALADVQARFDQLSPHAPSAGRIQDVFYQTGEWAAANQPIISLLPDDKVKVRFFAPEKDVARYRPGRVVKFACDGCASGLNAKITYVSPKPEFTPPIIYSRSSRDRLVFLVEALPVDPKGLAPGLPVEVTPIEEQAELEAGAVSFAIDVHGLNKSYGDKHVVRNASIQVEEGHICGFLGPNGAGKTTTLRMLCGLLTPDSGNGTCLGLDIIEDATEIKLRTGYMPQRFSLYEELTIEENLAFFARIRGLANRRACIESALERLGLQHRRNQLAGQLSGGWKQRLALAGSILHTPKLLLLDEPTAGVDPEARRHFWEQIHMLAGEGVTVLVSTHYMDEAVRCHDIAYIVYGRMKARGTSDEVIAASGLITFEGEGARADLLAPELSRAPGVAMAAPLGKSVHVCGIDRPTLEAAIAPYRREPYRWREVDPSLEDVFIHLMDGAEDNFQ